jgi:pantoate--beta-alanine ligase
VTTLISTREELDAALAETAPTAVVMTMGALHEGHAELMREARRRLPEGGRLIVTDFVNPTQFGAGEDFDRYPRTLEADVDVCARNGVDIVFAPSVAEVYGGGELGITVDPGPRGSILEGASRPGHFAGVLTVVAKLMHMTRPDIALFGEKDYQQLVLIRDMASALDFGVEVIGVPTVREPDGLAMSSRNRYLSDDARARAAAIPRALEAGQAAALNGAAAVVAAAQAILRGEGIDVDYVTVTDVALGQPPESGAGRLLIAVRIDQTRLIDNVAIDFGGLA